MRYITNKQIKREDEMAQENKFRIAVRGMIKRQDKYLLLERAKPSRGEMGYWELPGGGLDFGESPQQALVRELEEETGLSISVKHPLCVWHHMRGENTQIIGMTFLCQANNDDVVLSDEHIAYEWLSLDEIKQKKIFPELLDELREMKL